MKKPSSGVLILTMLGTIAIVLHHFSLPAKKENGFVEATQAAFIKLDRKVVKCTSPDFIFETGDPTEPIAPLFENLGNHHYAVTTSSEEAQKFFDQGLRLTYAFNHAEAHRSFREAARLDPNCAMAYWGQAFALGSNINDPFLDTERITKAYEAVQKAAELADQVSSKEKDLIEALTTRQSADTTADLNVLNQAYSDAMQEVARKYPDDPDILTLYADAVMNTMPWNYWDADGTPHPGVLEAKKALESAIALNPDHPGAHHSYIHMVELPYPEQGVPSAEKLGSFMPAAGHLVHMPSHIFIRVGRYEDAVKANIDAVAADEEYISQCYAQGMYPLGYYPHNIHFLWSASSLLGDSKTAIEAAKKTAEKVPISELTTLTFLQDYITTPMLAYTRFGKWNEVLTIPKPGDQYKHVMLIWHYTRGIAFLHKNNIKEAEEELTAIEQLIQDPELESLIANYTNPTSSIAKVAQRVVAGEIAAAQENYDHAIALLQEGVAFEDALVYSEPVAWHIPVRQNLGAVLLKADRPAEAEVVYKEELEKNRENGWSLIGLYHSLQAQGKTQEANEVMLRFEKAWALSDIQIDGSVM